ncbi:MAG: phosphoribosylformylglycinamidine synthase subunit PurL [Endomicrobium sp.]|jgi:phosphoribosylformylglycinamidine synthase|nr:phosphoribosylformylglycinamidine synthase subunit PurL [Endomicrobium sp.]
MKDVNGCNIVDMLDLSDNQLVKLSKNNTFSLSLEEMKVIQRYFQGLKRNPTDIEIETIAQTWSEHCKHKTLTGIIRYTEFDDTKAQKVKTYKNLLKETIFKVTMELNKKWCWSVFEDNAGIIEFDSKNGVAFKVETHNHPSALDPYGGTSTGVGGAIRDILGVGLGAKPLANTNVFCFGNPNVELREIPKNIHHPKKVIKDAVAGVGDYGNKMGIPTVNGAVHFDNGYISNPLVYCGTFGIIPKNKIRKKVNVGDLILLVGGKTGRDGIHGATFSSLQLSYESDVNAVQMGNPIIEKKVLDAMLNARDLNLYRSVTDCGAGGLSSAIGELGRKTGAIVYLNKVPLKYSGLRPWEIWISEAQERMVFAVPPENKNKIIKVFKKEKVEAVFIGEFTKNKRLIIKYNNDVIANICMVFLHNEMPKSTKTAVYRIKKEKLQKSIKMSDDKISRTLKTLLSDLNICSREWIVRQYDHEVQGQTIVKPLQGNSIEISGPGDASIIFPYNIINGTKKGVVLSNGLNPQYGKINTYKMAASAIEEALRNAVAVGANIEKIALLDNFCWGNPNYPKILGGIVRAANACYDVAKAFETPFISGKDSLYNEYSIICKKYSIPSTILISAIGIIEDISKTITMPLKNKNNKLFLAGITRNELGGSVFAKIINISDGIVPSVYPMESKIIMKNIHMAIKKNLVESCHDCSEGGFAVAASEMAFASGKGIIINIDSIKTDMCPMTPIEILFSESNGRFIIEVKCENELKLREIFKNAVLTEVGYVSDDNNVIFESKMHKIRIKENTEDLLKAWRNTLNW